jgi:hypothetical protein
VARCRRSKISEVLVASTLALFGVACGASNLETQLDLKDATRKPDGVLVEPTPAMPAPEEHGAAQAGILALRQPIGDEQIAEVVKKYVHAFVDTDRNGFADLFENDAVMFMDNGRSSARTTITQNFDERIRQHRGEYRLYPDVARLDRIMQWSSDDLGPHTDPPRPNEMKPGDVYARIPIQSPLSQSGDPLYKNTLILLLRRGADRQLKIAGVAETDAP